MEMGYPPADRWIWGNVLSSFNSVRRRAPAKTNLVYFISFYFFSFLFFFFFLSILYRFCSVMFCFCNGVWPLFNKRLLTYLLTWCILGVTEHFCFRDTGRPAVNHENSVLQKCRIIIFNSPPNFSKKFSSNFLWRIISAPRFLWCRRPWM